MVCITGTNSLFLQGIIRRTPSSPIFVCLFKQQVIIPVPGERDNEALGEIMNWGSLPTFHHLCAFVRDEKLQNAQRPGREMRNKFRNMNSALTMAGIELFPARSSAKSSMRQAPLASQLP
jgi:hypothetical protein